MMMTTNKVPTLVKSVSLLKLMKSVKIAAKKQFQGSELHRSDQKFADFMDNQALDVLKL